MSKSATPWTDANEEDGWNPCGWAVDSNLVRELERELTAARQELKAVTEQRNEWKAKFIQQNKDLGCEMMDPNGTIWDYAKKLQTELPAAREEMPVGYIPNHTIETLPTMIQEQSQMLAEETTCSKKLQEQRDKYHDYWESFGEERIKLKTELATVTEQRDQYKAALQSADNHNHEIATKLEMVTEQRDEAREACSPSFDTTETDAAWSAHCIDPDSASGDPWDLAKKLETELTAVTEQLKETRKHLKDANRGAEINAHALRINADKLIAVTEQRDRLADAMGEMWSFIWQNENIISPSFNAAIKKYKEALQSLNQN